LRRVCRLLICIALVAAACYLYFVWVLPPLLAALFGRFVDSPA
jgi:hypothetical protein